MNSAIRSTLISAYNLGSLPEVEQNAIIEQIGGVVFQNIIIRAMEVMSQDQQNEFEALLDKDTSGEELAAFLEKNVPNFDAIAKEEADKFREDSMAIMNQVGK